MTGFQFKAGAQKNLFEFYEFWFLKDNPLRPNDVDCIKVMNKTMFKDTELVQIIHKSIDHEEQGTSQVMKQLDDEEIVDSFMVLKKLRLHRRIERILGADSKEAIKVTFQKGLTFFKLIVLNLTVLSKSH